MSARWWHTANDIVHDLSAGLWPGAAAALWLVNDSSRTALPESTLSVARAAWSSVYLVLFVSLGLLVVTGALRLNYAAAGGRRTRTVLFKHAVFVTVLVLATAVVIGTLRQ